MGSNCVSAPKCRCRPAKKKRPLCYSDSATSTPVPTGKQNNFTAVWSKLFTCVIITFLLCLLNYMGNVSHLRGNPYKIYQTYSFRVVVSASPVREEKKGE